MKSSSVKSPAKERTSLSVKKAAPTSAEPVSSPMVRDEETLSHQVLNALRREIISGVLPPGARLVRRTVAKRFGVSTLPVVEALYRLEMEGLVENVPHAGARVVEPQAAVVEGDRIVREAIEYQVARLLAEMGPRGPLPELYARAELLDEVEHDTAPTGGLGGDAYLLAHLNFHLSLAEATGWKVLVSHLQGIWFRRIMVSIAQNKSWYEVPPNWHRQLIEAIETGDPDIAERKMREHVHHSRDRYRQSLKETVKRDQEEWLARFTVLGTRAGNKNKVR